MLFKGSVFFFSSRRRHTRYIGDWSSDVCSSDLERGSLPLATLKIVLRSALVRRKLIVQFRDLELGDAQSRCRSCPASPVVLDQALYLKLWISRSVSRHYNPLKGHSLACLKRVATGHHRVGLVVLLVR